MSLSTCSCTNSYDKSKHSLGLLILLFKFVLIDSFHCQLKFVKFMTKYCLGQWGVVILVVAFTHINSETTFTTIILLGNKDTTTTLARHEQIYSLYSMIFYECTHTHRSQIGQSKSACRFSLIISKIVERGEDTERRASAPRVRRSHNHGQVGHKRGKHRPSSTISTY